MLTTLATSFVHRSARHAPGLRNLLRRNHLRERSRLRYRYIVPEYLFLLVSVAVDWRYSARRFINRSLGTMTAVMPLVLSSEKLKDDVALIRLMGSQRKKIKCLEDLGRRYGFGYFYNPRDMSHCDVELDETDARHGGRSHVSV